MYLRSGFHQVYAVADNGGDILRHFASQWQVGPIVRHANAIIFALQVETDEAHIRKIWITRNPDKLTRF